MRFRKGRNIKYKQFFLRVFPIGPVGVGNEAAQSVLLLDVAVYGLIWKRKDVF